MTDFDDYEFIPAECLRPLDDVLSLTEASEQYGVPKPTLQSACTGQKGYPPLFTDRECRKAGSTWLVTRTAMERVYGKVSKHSKEVTEMEDKERREETAVHLAAELKKAMESMDEARAERAIGILIGLSANKELLAELKKESA